MQPTRTTISGMLAAAIATTFFVSAPALAANSAPAIAAFDQAYAGINDYTYQLHSHEVKGSATQNRVYAYSFMKPHFAKTLIVSGDGNGSGGVWAGGDQVSGHQGGFLSGIHLKISLHDARAISLRGYTIPDGLLWNIVNAYATTPGTLSQAVGGKIGGVQTDRLDLKVADPASNGGITEMVLYLSQATHMPMRQMLSVGSQVVLDQSFTDIKTNVGLKPSDFPF